ncbi:MAG TPA: HupE/UreJ family protein [Gammaproteobacteria bacterium]|nr:HupE/UreJ family protein [Gammaproteobacteria bacterium]
MTLKLRSVLVFSLTLIGFSPAVFAHPGHGLEGNLLTGLLHPLTGLDHLLAMLAVGMYAAQRGDRSLWAVPAMFVSCAGLGAALAMTGFALPLLETGIAASVLVFGLLLCLGARLALPGGIALAAGFALFHGFAHGAAAPAGAGLSYALGFLTATALLHAGGIALASLLRAPRLLRMAGGAIAAVGVLLLAA